MKYGILGCIICLLLIGAASAISINPVNIKQTIQQPGVAAATIQTAAITFDSSVHGATVYLDGNLLGADEAHSKTPVTDNEVTAGDHTVSFRLDGYKEFASTFHADAGKSQTIYAQLQQSPGVAAGQNITTLSPRVSLQVQDMTIRPVPVTTTSTQTFMTTPTPKPDLRVSVDANSVRQTGGGQESGKGDEGTGMTEGQLLPVAAAPPARTSTGLFESIFSGIFGGLFGQSVPKPPLNSSITGPTIPPGTSFNLDSYTVAPVIDKGATIYIGEEKLDVTHALNQARGTTTAADISAVPSLKVIGYWANPAQVYTTSPTRKIDLGAADRYKSMTVNPADFVGYPGDWYLLNASGIRPYSTGSVVFSVRDPALDLSVINAATLAGVAGTPVTKGTPIRFSITKNTAVKNPMGIASFRSPLAGTRDDGFLDIVVTDPAGNILTELAVTTDAGTKTTESLRKVCWDSTLVSPDCKPAYTWDTGATLSNGSSRYPSGTYTVQVISKLNNMHNDYKNAGLLYTGKTASGKITFTLA
jgi:hypothetical protein